MTNRTRGILYVLLSLACVVFFYIIVDWTFRNYPELDPVNATVWGFLGGTIMGSLFFMRKGELTKIQQEFKSRATLILVVSLLTTIGAFGIWIGLKETHSGISTLLGKSEIIFTILLSLLFLHERFTIWQWLSMAIIIIGLMVISGISAEISLIATVIILGARLLYALQSFLVKKYGSKIDSKSFAYLRAVTMTFFALLIAWVTKTLEPISLMPFLLLSLSQLFGLFLGRIFYFEAYKHLSISEINLIFVLEPILILMLAWLFFSDAIGLQKALGTVLITGGLVLFFLSRKNTTLAQKKFNDFSCGKICIFFTEK